LNIKLGEQVPTELMAQSFLAITPKEVARVRSQTELPLIVKGIMTPEDARIAVEAGADGVVVSNHGGRILDEAQASVEVLEGIAARAGVSSSGRKVEVFFDGGIRRGTSILKSMALGARACLIGRPVFWGLAVHRSEGVSAVLEILKSELVRAAALCGVKSLSSVRRDVVARA
jgi:isopentenyl diphosphate isomerase/L-lactate dehydrogenase-like FMN-dependent dehydrogenase